jgi:pentatricopeptide repeat protein
MCAKGYQPDSYHSFSLLKALADVPDPDRAARLVELLEAEGRQDKHVYNVFIGCLCKAGRIVAAFEAMGRMRGYGFHPKSSPHSSIVKGLCDHKMLEAALTTIEHFREEHRCAPNWVTYGNLIECAIVTRGVEEVPELLDQMAQDGLRPENPKTEAIYSMVIHNLCKSRKVGYITYQHLRPVVHLFTCFCWFCIWEKEIGWKNDHFILFCRLMTHWSSSSTCR